jgi:arylsulfatase A-like enzyme
MLLDVVIYMRVSLEKSMTGKSVLLFLFGAIVLGVIYFSVVADDMEGKATVDLTAVGSSEAEDAVRPNVLLIVIDTLRQDRLHARRGGERVMPYLEDFAAGGWEFTSAWSQSSWTKPSMVSILSGLYVSTHEVQFGVFKPFAHVADQDMRIEGVPSEIVMAAEYFSGAGYRSLGYQTNQHLQAQFGFAEGFAVYENMPWSDAGPLTDAALAGVADGEGPFFLYVHYFDPHSEYRPGAPYDAVFGEVPVFSAAEEGLLAEYNKHYYLDKIMYDMGVRSEPPAEAFSEMGRDGVRHLYDGECRYADAEVHRLIETVRARWPETLVALVSDHGEEFWEHGSLGHAKRLYEESVNVPLVFDFPGQEAARIGTAVETIDVLPTLAAAAGLEPLAGWQGRDLSGTVAAGGDVARAVFTETRSSIPEFGVCLRSVRQGDWKLLVDRSAGESYLYNLATDPGELLDVSGEHPARVAALEKLLAAHRVAAREHEAYSFARNIVGADEETIAQLEAIGYVGGDMQLRRGDCE